MGIVYHFREGLAFKSDNKQKIFNVRPLLMTIGFLLISGKAIMAYKTIPGTRKAQRLSHLILHFGSLLAGIVGIYAVFKYKNEYGLQDMYTLHSWLGLSTICLSGLQWIVAAFSFWWPRAEMPVRARVVPWHVFFGMVIFFMALLSVETGLVQKFDVLSLQRRLGSQEALMVNFTGLLVLLLGISFGLAVLLPRPY